MKHVVVDPITRIEGHLRVEVQVDEGSGKVTDALSSGTAWRGLELVMKDRDPRDAWAYIQRICGVCTSAHALGSLRAVEDALGIKIPKNANYIRNSVKATVDAYDGSVDLYVWDQSAPVIKAWEKIFPGQYHQLSEISGDLMSHMRYPESLFKVQRELLAKYHVSSANQFFSGEDFWQTPVDPTESQQAQQRDILQPPYYLTLQTGGSSEPVFSLTFPQARPPGKS